MNKKMTFGKILGIIFCLLAAACTVVLLFTNAYFSGQMKLIDKFFTAIERDDFESFKACFSEVQQEFITEERFAEWRNYTVTVKAIPIATEGDNETYSKSYSYPIDTDEYKVKTDFTKRGRLEKDKYFVTYDQTIYKDTDNDTMEGTSLLARQNGKWVLVRNSEITPLTEVYNGELGEMLKVLYHDTWSGRAEYEITGDDILSVYDTMGIANIDNTELRIGSAGEMNFETFGWYFKPINSGNCTITVDRYDGSIGDISYTDIYSVTVDENMKITYTMERTNIDGNKE